MDTSPLCCRVDSAKSPAPPPSSSPLWATTPRLPASPRRSTRSSSRANTSPPTSAASQPRPRLPTPSLS
jgi:hypothetical protein